LPFDPRPCAYLIAVAADTGSDARTNRGGAMALSASQAATGTDSLHAGW
jgi:hypothetical protein